MGRTAPNGVTAKSQADYEDEDEDDSDCKVIEPRYLGCYVGGWL